MRKAGVFAGVAVIAGVAAMAAVQAQAPAAPKPAAAKPAASAPTAARYRTHGNLNQVMRGILFPNSNVVFAAQSEDFAKIAQDKDPSTATDPLKGVYNSWTAVEDSGYALAEAANLLMIPGASAPTASPPPWPMRTGPSSSPGCATRAWRPSRPPRPRTRTRCST
jgi:hypothetical protein